MQKLDEAANKEEELESKQQKTSLKAAKQLTLAVSLKTSSTYRNNSDRYKQITRNFQCSLVAANVATAVVENLKFRDLLHTLDKRYQVPGRSVITKELQQVVIELKAKASTFIAEANKVCLC